MTEELGLLLSTAVSLGVVHTLLGPDHYVPFVAMAHANGWSTRRSLCVTAACGLAHVMSSVVLGILGLALGLVVLSLPTIQWIESTRGETAAWMLIVFGIGYLTYGLWKGFLTDKHDHSHVQSHGHSHGLSGIARSDGSSNHSEEQKSQPVLATDNEDSPYVPKATVDTTWSPWILFLVFAFGPCEALIPMLMYPAARANWFAVAAVVVAFGIATLLTMLGAVLLMRLGLKSVRLPDLHRYSHALAGVAVLLCGLAVKFGL